MTDQPEITMEKFSDGVNQPFSVKLEGVITEEMTLVDIREHPVENTERKAAPFTLTFHAPPTCILKDGTYTVTNDKCGSMDLFLTVEGDVDSHKTYEASFR